jgi:DNA-3-methyladenine glycosylase I
MKRCDWCKNDALYERYHDEEWGVRVDDDQVLFEFLILESMQAGLSWITILRKRENFREAFDQFKVERIAAYDETKVNELMLNTGIIRHRLKIESAIHNAKQFMKVQNEFGSFSNYMWSFVNHQPVVNHYQELSQIPTKTELSDKVSKDLKKRGFKFLGSVTIYSYLQAVGVIDDHLDSCFRKEQINHST